MRKWFALALVLVLALAGTSLAASPTLEGRLKVVFENVKDKDSSGDLEFSGPYELSPELRLDLNFDESGDNWSFEGRVRAELDFASVTEDFTEWDFTGWNFTGGSTSVTLNKYKGVLQAGPVTVTAARDYDLGNIDAPLKWLRLGGNVKFKDEDETPTDMLRVSTAVSGVQIDAQVHRGDEVAEPADPHNKQVHNLRARVQTEIENFTLGAGLRYGLQSGRGNDYMVYATTKFGIVELKGIYGSFYNKTSEENEGHYAIDVGADVTEFLNVGATYSDFTHGDTTEGYAVRAKFEQGILFAEAKHAELNRKTTFWFKYRGSEENQPFDILFDEDEDDWNDEWYKNVAPAFGVYFEDQKSAKPLIKAFAVAPFAGTAIARAKVETQDGDTGFAAEARFNLSDKLVLNPYVEQAIDKKDTRIGSKLIYEVSENSEVTLDASQKKDEQKLQATFELKF
ncbi:MAG: porin [Limnochordales bacterium]